MELPIIFSYSHKKKIHIKIYAVGILINQNHKFAKYLTLQFSWDSHDC